MPPRPLAAAVIVAWLAAIGWLAHDKWLPWLRPADEPAFLVELADEVAPEHASWLVYRQDKRIGSAETRLAARKDGLFEMTSRLRDLDVKMSLAQVKMPVFATTRLLTREGELVRLDAHAVLLMTGLGGDLRVEADIKGHVEGDQFVGTCDFDFGSGKTQQALEPIKLVSKNAFSPMQPMQKYPPLRPGQTWRVANLDPVTDALEGAVRQIADKLQREALGGKVLIALPKNKRPKELLAQVQSETEEIAHKGKTYTCRIIVFQADDVKARTWVDIADGRVIRQEASSSGDTIVLQRE
ncbi:MAG TPA: hypothetical protein VHR66_08745 [Gemmataceae bacterium]|jgi:hypothetical protein|nr:hypothetical protein [Gemmataceae bacterium]